MYKYLTLAIVALSATIQLYSQQYQILKQFDNEATGYNPSGTPIVVDSYYYGMTRSGGVHSFGTIYRMNFDGSNYKALHSFDRFSGSQPSGSLLLVGDWLYGMSYKSGTNDEGVIYKIKKDGTGKSVIHNFSTKPDDGSGPTGSLINVDSFLYGMTQHGGENNRGTIFRIREDGSEFSLLHSFDFERDSGAVPHNDLVYKDGLLYGIAQHIVFSIKPDGSGFKIIKVFWFGRRDGYMTLGTPLIKDSVLFGITLSKDSTHKGSIFRVNLDGSDFRTIYDFPLKDSIAGMQPAGMLSYYKGKIYGMASMGGAFGMGTIYSINTDGTNYQALYSFGTIENDGRGPGTYSGLLCHNNSLLGVTGWGGTKNGVFFRLGNIALLDTCDETSFTYNNFSNSKNIVFNGDAKVKYDRLRLCPAAVSDSGAVYYNLPVPIASNFKTEFTFSFSNGFNDFDDGSPAGADGIAFVIQGNDTRKIGNSGAGIGYSGISNCLAVEFDAYNNGDDMAETNGSHLAVFSNGRARISSDHHSYGLLGYTANIPVLKADSSIYFAKIAYKYENKTLKIWLDKTGDFITPVLIIDSLDLPALLKPIDNNKAYIGFTSATGTSYQNTDLLTWSWCFNNEQIVAGITDNEQSILSISPNPASDYFEISCPPLAGVGGGPTVSVRIYDLLGVEITTPNLTPALSKGEGVVRIDISSLQPGVYFVRVGDEMRKFIKM